MSEKYYLSGRTSQRVKVDSECIPNEITITEERVDDSILGNNKESQINTNRS